MARKSKRPFLYDDLNVIRLPFDLIAHPPIELWPGVVIRIPVPADLAEVVIRPSALSAVRGTG